MLEVGGEEEAVRAKGLRADVFEQFALAFLALLLSASILVDHLYENYNKELTTWINHYYLYYQPD
jgi:hypothetical protein